MIFKHCVPLNITFLLTFQHLSTNATNRCPRGQRVTPDGKSCVDRNECLDNPCRNGGQCINRDTVERYTCLCPSGFSGHNCELMQEEQILRLSMGALAIILLCLLSILSKTQGSLQVVLFSFRSFSFLYFCITPFTFFILFLLILFRCPAGQIRVSPDRAECVYDADCFGVNTCLNGGTCIKEYLYSGRPSFCLCPINYEGPRCEISTDQTVYLSGGKDFVIIIIFALATLLSKFLVYHFLVLFSVNHSV